MSKNYSEAEEKWNDVWDIIALFIFFLFIPCVMGFIGARIFTDYSSQAPTLPVVVNTNADVLNSFISQYLQDRCKDKGGVYSDGSKKGEELIFGKGGILQNYRPIAGSAPIIYKGLETCTVGKDVYQIENNQWVSHADTTIEKNGVHFENIIDKTL